jgi:alpha-tubulin suppressor-like RCC1 family protein
MKKIILIVVVLFSCNICSAQTISAGSFFSAAVCSDNTVRTWGWNNSGQLGNNTFADDSIPGQVTGITGVIKIASGGGHTLALKNNGTVWAWGNNFNGQLGDNTTIDRPYPVQVNGLTGIVSIACGESSSFAIKNDGTLWAWGYNAMGMLGDSTSIDRHSPIQVHGIGGVISVSAGSFHTLALKIDGTVWSIGNNYEGEGGNNDGINEHWTPVQSLITDIRAIACGGYFSLALKNDSTIWGWGDGSFGELGDSVYNFLNNVYVPIQVNSIVGWNKIGAGFNHSMAIKNDGTVWGWGSNGEGQLGFGVLVDTTLPVQMNVLPTDVTVTSEAWHSLILKNDSTLWACGSNYNGELGNGTTSGNNPNPTPGQVISLCAILVPPVNCTSNYSLTADTSQPHTYFLVSNPSGIPPFRHLWSWGDNTYDTLPYPSHTYADTGYYTICHSVFDATGCSSVFCNSSNLMIVPPQMVTVNVVSSIPNFISENNSPNEISLFPNPVTNELVISGSGLGETETIEIYNAFGEKLLSQHNTNDKTQTSIDVSSLQSGIYFITLTNEAGNKAVRKFVKM